MEGWACPKCGRCYSPFVRACGWCGPVAITVGTDSWDYGDYMKHGVFPGIDDYIRATGGHVNPWTGKEGLQ